METVDAQYGTAAQALLAQYEQDPTNPTTLLNVANGYFDWGVAAMNHAASDEDSAHARELLARAGLALSRSSKFDVIVEFYLARGVHDVMTVNEALFAFDQPLLGSQ